MISSQVSTALRFGRDTRFSDGRLSGGRAARGGGGGGKRLDGILGAGDSGGSASVQRNGRWYVIGVNVTGSGDKYDGHSYFTRPIGARPWHNTHLPGLRFTQ